MSMRKAIAAVCISAGLAVSAGLASPATAQVVPGGPLHNGNLNCSQGFAGTVIKDDGAAENIMVTAGHCLDQGQKAVVGFRGGLVEVGDTIAQGFIRPFVSYQYGLNGIFFGIPHSSDWAIARLYPHIGMTRNAQSAGSNGPINSFPRALTGIRDYGDLAPGQISTDNAGQLICKDGSRSGRLCGIQIARTRDNIFHTPITILGDSGGAVYDPLSGQVLGTVSGSWGPVDNTQAADATLQDAYGIPDGQVNQRFHLAP